MVYGLIQTCKAILQTETSYWRQKTPAQKAQTKQKGYGKQDNRFVPLCKRVKQKHISEHLQPLGRWVRTTEEDTGLNFC